MVYTLNKLEKYTIYIIVFLLPLAFLPIFANAFAPTKLIVLVVGICLVILIKIATMAKTGIFEFQAGKFDLPIFIIAATYLISGLTTTPNKAEAFFLPGTASAFVGAGLLYFLVNQLDEKGKDGLISVIFASVGTLAVVQLMILAGIFRNFQQLPAYMRSADFSLQGSPISTALIFAATLPYALRLITNTAETAFRALFAVATILIGIALALISFDLVLDKSNQPRITSFGSSWSVAIDTLKVSPAFGFGPGNYISAYDRFKPLTVNLTDNWAFRFGQARNLYLTMITETGFVGAFGLALLAIVTFRHVKDLLKKASGKIPLDPRMITVVVLLVLLALFPATIEVVVLLVVGLAIATSTKKFQFRLFAQSRDETRNEVFISRLPAFFIFTPIVIGIAVLAVFGVRAVSAESLYKIALDHLGANRARETIETLVSAINSHPYIDRYHTTYSQVNFLLAQSIASQTQGNPTDEQRQTITDLVLRSIREANSAVATNRSRAANWEYLGNTYANLINISKDEAGNFAIQAYSQAIILDPFNPETRIALGRVYYALQKYEEAVEVLRLAVVAKPNHANARYQLANAYKQKGENDKAINELKAVLQIVDPNSNDYKVAKGELDELEAKKKETGGDQGQGETLTNPPSTEKAINPPIDLPEAAEPVEPAVTPTPTPIASPNPTQTDQ